MGLPWIRLDTSFPTNPKVLELRTPTIPDRYLAALPEGSRIPAEKRGWLKAEWAKLRAERELDGDR